VSRRRLPTITARAAGELAHEALMSATVVPRGRARSNGSVSSCATFQHSYRSKGLKNPS
jgi:hypothetical protein